MTKFNTLGRRSITAFGCAILAVATLGSGFALRPAAADIVSYVNVQSTQTANFSDSFALPLFNPSLGTLTSVQLTLTSTLSPVAQVFHITSTLSDSFSNATTLETINFTGPDGTVVPVSASSGSFNGTGLGSGVSSYPGPVATGVTNTVSVPSANYPSYEGVGNATFTFASAPFLSSGSSSPEAVFFFGGAGSADGDATVTYTYTPTPEPASLGLLTAAGLLAVRRRRRV
jgi:hypothetical protein